MKIFYLIFLTFIISSCLNLNDDLQLNKIQIDGSTEIDTLESHTTRGLYIIQIIHPMLLGDFSTTYGVIKKSKDGKVLAYEILDKEKKGKRISKDFIASVDSYGKTNWGWFCIDNGKLKVQLPGISKILDSLKSIRIKRDMIRETNGNINFYLDGKIVETFNYGSFFVKGVDFKNLDYNLYELNDSNLRVVSKNVDDIFKQREGIFYIPSPGYGVIHKYKKTQVLDAVDSVSELESPPKILRIKVFN